jgi:hypothetical protein
MHHQYLRLSRRSHAFLIVLCLCIATSAADWSEPARQLAKDVAAQIGNTEISIDIQNRSSLAQSDVDAIRAVLGRELANLGVRLSGSRQPGNSVRITLSENLEAYIWIAEIPGATVGDALMLSVPRLRQTGVIHEPVSLVIRKVQLWTQAEPMLDVAVIDTSPPRLIVLESDRIAIYELEGTNWRARNRFELKHSRPWPRDLRGRLILRRDHLFDAYLPGVSCSSGPKSELSLACHESDDPWPLGPDSDSTTAFFSPARNFFTGVLVTAIGSNRTVPPFYSVANVSTNDESSWIFAAIDGKARMTSGSDMEFVSAPDWGSDIASLKTECRSGNQILATANTATTGDSIRAYELNEKRAVPVSQPLDFEGRVTALWAESGGRNAVSIVHNEITGDYEAFRLAIACGP